MTLDHPLVVGAILTLFASLLGGVGVLFKFLRRVDATMDDMRDHVVPHFRPATIEEIRTGVRTEGDTIPERVAILERDLAIQTAALGDHLETETVESAAIKGRLESIENKLDIKGGS